MTESDQKTDACSTCKGEGWLMESEGEPCPDCSTEDTIGGTGKTL